MKHSNRLVNMAIETCADSIEELRECDVLRAMETADANGSLLDTYHYILENRPEFSEALFEASKLIKLLPIKP